MLTGGQMIFAVVGVILTWLIFVLAMCKLAKLYSLLNTMKKNTDMNFTGIATSLKSIQSGCAELVVEQRRTNKLLVELIDNGKNT